MDPKRRIFTRLLVKAMAAAHTAAPAKTPKDALVTGYNAVHGRGKLAPQGSCTVGAVDVAPDGRTLRTALVGDSGVAVVRAGELVLRTKEQQRQFNFPMQVGVCVGGRRGRARPGADRTPQTPRGLAAGGGGGAAARAGE